MSHWLYKYRIVVYFNLFCYKEYFVVYVSLKTHLQITEFPSVLNEYTVSSIRSNFVQTV